MTKPGDSIRTILAIQNRQCFWLESGQPGGPILSFPISTRMTAATLELGGSIFGATQDPTGKGIAVPLGESEWEPHATAS